MSSVSQFPPPHLIAEEEEQAKKQTDTEAGNQGQPHVPLGLPAPGDASAQEQAAREDDDGAVKFDRLGPMVVNTDGTISRIHNWDTMTEGERERTKRLVVKRNQTRLAQLRAAEEAQAAAAAAAPTTGGE